MSINGWKSEENVVYINSGILLSHKKDENFPFLAIWMDLDYYVKWSKSDEERQIPYDVTYMCSINE